MTTLLLVRHGETYDNENQIMQGQTQGQLNPRGIEQAQQLAREMAQRDINAFVASDLNRAIETCRIIAEPHHAELITTPLLRERDWGAPPTAARTRLGSIHRALHSQSEGRAVSRRCRESRRPFPARPALHRLHKRALPWPDSSRRGSRDNKQGDTSTILRQADA